MNIWFNLQFSIKVQIQIHSFKDPTRCPSSNTSTKSNFIGIIISKNQNLSNCPSYSFQHENIHQHPNKTIIHSGRLFVVKTFSQQYNYVLNVSTYSDPFVLLQYTTIKRSTIGFKTGANDVRMGEKQKRKRLRTASAQ